MAQVWANNAISTLAAGVGYTDLTIFIQPSHGSRFPVVVAPNFAYCTLEDASGNIEVVKVTAHGAGSSSLTVVRAQQGTAAQNFIAGDLFELRATAVEFGAWEADIDSLEATRARKAGDTYTGAHDFSGAAAVALPANTSIGSVSASEIGYLDGLTGSIQGQLNLRALKAGDTYTGTHNFTGATAVNLPTATSIGVVSDTEISYLDGVTSSIQGQMNALSTAKANKAGETYSGTHDFNSAIVIVPTQPAGTNNGTAASTAFATQLAFSSFANLPGDPGDNLLRVLSTQSGTKSWAPIPMSDQAQYLAGIY